mmetsp:Transcript_31761/g.61997  ORF Transcript_31761/g.61997 Transcript_31761/m.61997 type:complete len:681 (+) Transcript_31761:236-2278(+)|eukprot:CAMPEP_0173410864 /NCGR_PEP_ID=MMETSP1356-20130122/75550_1 /TAXON_ID=77927 ORGANISM="Hemiselmis virescens, Strain PCC157" /NCGR_SAMPLE_ID=MMETSP1356 /ASSEMBLY_ACC=CAM_ASM_000847 /LENGTH=680 /DNA_ID=CAMNT_0014372529 /DNA_START=183 /DNA_END=2225 /DNA_ORIENTATION=-
MAVVTFVKRQNQSARRKALAEKKAQHAKFIKDTLKKWDASGTGALNFEELRKWLSDITGSKVTPTDDEVKWVQSMANFAKSGLVEKEGGNAEMVLTASVLPEDFSLAAQAWMSYVDSKDDIDAMFKKFDKDHSSYLDKPQLAELLTSLNDGEAVPDSEVDWVLSTSDTLGNGVITPPELSKALSLWYAREREVRMPTIEAPHAKMTTNSVIKILPSKFANQSARRKAIIQKKKEHHKFVQDTLAKWDASGTGGLNFDELKKWLSEISAGAEATEDEVHWVQVMAQKEKIKVGTFKKKEDLFDASVLPEDFVAAVEVWMAYKDSKEEIEATFAKYDTDQSDSLDRPQLTSLLTDLNDGVTPEEAEVDWVFTNADQLGNGVITKPELKKALGLWFSRDDPSALAAADADAVVGAAKAVSPRPAAAAAAEKPKKKIKSAATTLDELKSIKRSNQAARRKEVARMQEAKGDFIAETLAKWDKNNSGSLSFEELKAWLSENSAGGPATDEEVMWIASLANMDKIKDKQEAAKASVLPQDFPAAAKAWMAYKESKDEIEAVFAKFDTDKSGALDKAQLTQLLKSLNDGTPPNDAEVDWVMNNADQIGNGTITKPELSKATALWFAHVDADAHAAKAPAPAPAAAAAAPAAAAPAPAAAATPTTPGGTGTTGAAVKPTPACGGCSVQ